MPTNATHGTYADLMATTPAPLRAVCEALRRQIAALHPDGTCIVWPRQRIASFGVGPAKRTQHYAYLAVHAAHVNLGFHHGAALPDPAGLLQGAGKRLRHVKVGGVGPAASPAPIALLRHAIADRQRERVR